MPPLSQDRQHTLMNVTNITANAVNDAYELLYSTEPCPWCELLQSEKDSQVQEELEAELWSTAYQARRPDADSVLEVAKQSIPNVRPEHLLRHFALCAITQPPAPNQFNRAYSLQRFTVAAPLLAVLLVGFAAQWGPVPRKSFYNILVGTLRNERPQDVLRMLAWLYTQYYLFRFHQNVVIDNEPLLPNEQIYIMPGRNAKPVIDAIFGLAPGATRSEAAIANIGQLPDRLTARAKLAHNFERLYSAGAAGLLRSAYGPNIGQPKIDQRTRVVAGASTDLGAWILAAPNLESVPGLVRLAITLTAKGKPPETWPVPAHLLKKAVIMITKEDVFGRENFLERIVNIRPDISIEIV